MRGLSLDIVELQLCHHSLQNLQPTRCPPDQMVDMNNHLIHHHEYHIESGFNFTLGGMM
jgi:hypothetical protein